MNPAINGPLMVVLSAPGKTAYCFLQRTGTRGESRTPCLCTVFDRHSFDALPLLIIASG